MLKISIVYLVFLLFLSNCSIDTNSNFWDNNRVEKKKSDLKFDYNLSYNEYKKNVIEYGETSLFPSLDN